VKTWHIVAPEYPPRCGGVGDYTALLAGGLSAAGDRVTVWHPGVLPDRFGSHSREVMRSALARQPGILLVQYVPSAVGLRGLNVPFCRWLARLAHGGVDVRVMFHEPFFYYGWQRPWRNVLALVQRRMAAMLLRSATRVYYSTESWQRLLEPYGAPLSAEVLPIPATIPVDVADGTVAHLKARFLGEPLIGHFGTYGEHVAELLARVVPPILAQLPGARVLLTGRGATAFSQQLGGAALGRVDVLDNHEGASIAAALRACDILVQPFPDGVTTRRTSMMAALSSGRPVVTTRGELTEPVWDDEAVVMAPAVLMDSFVEEVTRLASDASRRRTIGMRGRQLYDERFALAGTIGRIRR
jgi:glycosyltransferase involved in cell wall biosynthesis